MRQVVQTDGAPRPIGPYSQAVRVGNMLFVAGQLPVDPATGELVKGGIREQTRRVMENIRAVLEAAGFTMADVAMAIVFLADLSLFNEFNQVYGEYFREAPPARVTVQAARLPRDALVEVAVIAAR